MSTDTYQDWMARVLGGRDGLPLSPDDVVRTPGGKPFASIDFLRFDREKYIGEVGQKGDDFVYHFYPQSVLPPDFEDHMAAAFLEVFKLEDRIQAAYTEELGSWAVRVMGFAVNPLSDVLTTRVFDVLDRRLG